MEQEETPRGEGCRASEHGQPVVGEKEGQAAQLDEATRRAVLDRIGQGSEGIGGQIRALERGDPEEASAESEEEEEQEAQEEASAESKEEEDGQEEQGAEATRCAVLDRIGQGVEEIGGQIGALERGDPKEASAESEEEEQEAQEEASAESEEEEDDHWQGGQGEEDEEEEGDEERVRQDGHEDDTSDFVYAGTEEEPEPEPSPKRRRGGGAGRW